MSHPLAKLVASLVLAAVTTAQVPNVLLVVADDLGVDYVGCYGLGSDPALTPYIDAFAATGVRFLNAQACPLCSPSRASMLTGRHGFRTGVGAPVGGSTAGLASSEIILPEVLATGGIQTALFGKWHLGEDLDWQTPTDAGFGTFVGSLGGSLAPGYFNWQKVDGGPATACTTYATTDTVDEALAFIATAPEPWFVMVSFNAGHTPFHVPPSSLLSAATSAGLTAASPDIDKFKAMIEAMDKEFDRLLTSIPAATFANTNVVFMGDNGTLDSVVQPPFLSAQNKGTVYQGGIRVPLIVAGPAVGGAPRTEPNLVHVVDLFATIAAMQGVSIAAAVPASVKLDALDVSSLLAAPLQPPVRRYSYSQRFAGSTAMAASGDSEMIRSAQYSLLRFQDGTTAATVSEKMFDLFADPYEEIDLLASPLTASARTAYDNLRRELALLRGYGWSRPYGANCAHCGVAPLLTQAAASSLRIGTTWSLQVEGLTPSVLATVGGIGFQNVTWNGLALPVDLTVVGASGCWLSIDPVVTMLLSASGSTASLPIVLPNEPTLVGQQLYAQAFPLLIGCVATGLISTNAMEAVLGN
jgi:arylsulfatase B